MTPSAFTKLGLRLFALHVGLFTALPRLSRWVPSAVDAQPMAYAYVVQAIIMAGIAVWLWMAADYIVHIILPARVSRDIPPDYPRQQGLALMLTGGLVVFEGVHLFLFPFHEASAIPQWPIYAVIGLALFCAPVWQRRH